MSDKPETVKFTAPLRSNDHDVISPQAMERLAQTAPDKPVLLNSDQGKPLGRITTAEVHGDGLRIVVEGPEILKLLQAGLELRAEPTYLLRKWRLTPARTGVRSA